MYPKLVDVGKAVVQLQLRRLARRFLTQVGDPRGVQHAVLRQLLSLNADSDFARQHAFREIQSVTDFRRRVPIADYSYFQPYIDRLKQGETNALLGTRNRLLMFAMTSGTTAESKFLPITRRFLADYRRGWRIWSIRAYDDHPPLIRQSIVQVSSDHDQFRTTGGHPCGNISGLVSAMQISIVHSMYAVPAIVAKIKSPEAKYYTAMRLALAERGVGLVMTANPSTLVHLAKLGDSCRQELIRDIFDGRLSSRFEIGDGVRAALGARLSRKDPSRARELEQIVQTTGRLYPRDYWPAMSLVSVWTAGSAAAYMRGLRSYFGDIPIRDHGLSASEGRMTIPLCDGRADGILDISSHFFEFIPESEHGSAAPTVLEAHELAEGANYYILLTTAAGLCRYDIHDVVRCTGFCKGTPLLEFLNKGSQISSITGEKITESQVVAAVGRATVAANLQLSCFSVAPVWGDPPGYRLLVEATDLPAPEAGRRLSAQADAQLQSLNREYGEKRRSGRLAPLESVLLPPGSWTRFTRAQRSKIGSSIEQYKHPCLVPDPAFYEKFLEEFAVVPARPADAIKE